jgi:hypothetical protein
MDLLAKDLQFLKDWETDFIYPTNSEEWRAQYLIFTMELHLLEPPDFSKLTLEGYVRNKSLMRQKRFLEALIQICQVEFHDPKEQDQQERAQSQIRELLDRMKEEVMNLGYFVSPKTLFRRVEKLTMIRVEVEKLEEGDRKRGKLALYYQLADCLLCPWVFQDMGSKLGEVLDDEFFNPLLA